jgi:hypothetical protein
LEFLTTISLRLLGLFYDRRGAKELERDTRIFLAVHSYAGAL